MAKSWIKKALIFKLIYEQLGKDINSIKLVLFYDAVHKFNYEPELNRAMKDELSNDEKILKMIEFQCIYIKPSYLAAGTYTFKNEITKLQAKLQAKLENENIKLETKLQNENTILKIKVEKLENEITELNRKINELTKNINNNETKEKNEEKGKKERDKKNE